jgi:hypothetical protein
MTRMVIAEEHTSDRASIHMKAVHLGVPAPHPRVAALPEVPEGGSRAEGAPSRAPPGGLKVQRRKGSAGDPPGMANILPVPL